MKRTHLSTKTLQFRQEMVTLNWIVGCKNRNAPDNLLINCFKTRSTLLVLNIYLNLEC